MTRDEAVKAINRFLLVSEGEVMADHHLDLGRWTGSKS